MKGHISKDCYYCVNETRIQWGKIPYHNSGDKPLTRKQRQRIHCMDDQHEAEALAISLALQTYDPNFPSPDPVFLQPELHIQPCPVFDEFGHKAVLNYVLYALRLVNAIILWQVHGLKPIHTTSLLRKTYLILII
jgi:hypothetical protein